MDTPIYPAFEYDDDSWSTLSYWLTPQVRGWVYAHPLPCWQGDEDEIVKDIVALAVSRIYERIKKVCANLARPIVSMQAFARRTARNCFIDQVRKDRKKMRLSQISEGSEMSVIVDNLLSMEESVHEKLVREQLFGVVAREISHFPRKQREAILKEQARLLDGLPDPTSLLRAYHDVGIRLLDYYSQESMNENERSRHSSLLYHAYRRLSQLSSVQSFFSDKAV